MTLLFLYFFKFPGGEIAGGIVATAIKLSPFSRFFDYHPSSILRTQNICLFNKGFGKFTIRKCTARNKLAESTVANHKRRSALRTFFIQFFCFYFDPCCVFHLTQFF